MKKLAMILGGYVCLKIMKQPKTPLPVRTVNNYFIKSGGGCSGSCGGHCHCGKH